MDLNKTPRSSRVHIAFFGKSNAGKSSLINAVTNQDLAIVSHIKGTTTDPVYKSIEILPIGPCELIDTAGLDDFSELGELRIKKTIEILNKTDIGIYVADASSDIDDGDALIISKIKEKNIPLIIALNKIDISKASSSVNATLNPATTSFVNFSTTPAVLEKRFGAKVISVSATEKTGIIELREALAAAIPQNEDAFKIIGDLIGPSDIVVLVTPIDKAAPKGRLILPQQQVIRDILESDAIAIVTKEYELKETLESLNKKPKLVITDSQAFLKVSADTPKDIMLTSFSIVFARFKGDLVEMVKGVKAIKELKDGDVILVAEGCTHHCQADDIGKVKIPRWLRQLTGKELIFEYTSGCTYGDDSSKYALIVHCGACMITKKEMLNRISTAKIKNIPIVNYGILIAYVQGILGRVLEPFPLAKMTWDEIDI